MIHIILLILKILGCIILGILALILAAVLIVLFVPFKYELSAAYDGAPEAGGKLSWLFGALKVRGSFKDKKIRARASILWFRIFSMGEDEEKAADTVQEAAADAEEAVKAETEDILSAPEDIFEEETIGSREAVPPEEEATESSSAGELPAADAEPEEEKKPEIKPEALPEPDKTPEKVKKVKQKKKTKQKKEGKLSALRKQYDKLVHTKDMAERFWNADFTQGSIAFAKKAAASLLRHVLPKKAAGHIRFGFDKPADTGKILGYASMLYAWYGDFLTLQPDFDRAVLEGNIDIRGSIRLYIFLYWGLRGLLNKDLRKLIKFIKHFKGKEETLWQ